MMLQDFVPDWKSPDYYFFPDDVKRWPDAWLYVVWSRRGPGKTYSFLRACYETGTKFAYMKRTIKDVAMICSNKYGFDLSPFVPINRDSGSIVRPRLIADGIGAFYDHENEKGEPSGAPVSYVLALNAIKEIKGMELSDVDYMCLDEFIPQPGERVSRQEGELLLSIYMTLQRDRIKRGRPPLKLVLFSNADQVSTPITNEIEIVDDMVELEASGKTHNYIEARGILLHRITEEEVPLREEELKGVFAAMAGTAWGQKSFYGSFASNDFSSIGRVRMKGMRPICAYTYRNRTVYVYAGAGEFFLTWSRSDTKRHYDLQKESDQKRFYYEQVIDLRTAHIDGRLTAESYSMYDLIVNYKQFFKIS